MEGVETQGESQAEVFKNQGNDAFKNGNYELAIQLYTQALGNFAAI